MRGKILMLIGVVALVGLGLGYMLGLQNGKAASMVETAPNDSMAQQKALPGYGADMTAIQSAIVGTWKSTDDAKFTRAFKADGTVTDAYEGDAGATSTGTWKLFTAGDVDSEFKGTASSDTTYLKITEGADVYFYSVNEAMGDSLKLTYLDRGNLLSFTRVN